MGRYVEEELASQPQCWQRAADSVSRYADVLPAPGDRVAVVGCGTSLHIATAYAAAREASGAGVTDAFPASEAWLSRDYDVVLAVSRSGTTTEVIETLLRAPRRARRVVITTDPHAPIAEHAQDLVELEYADERAVVQTRFASTTLVLLLASLNTDVAPAIEQCRRVLDQDPDETLVDRPHYVFLGRGWTIGLASEAALKMREAAMAWTESYPALEYRHGPLSAATRASVVWLLGAPAPGLVDDIAASGATVVADAWEPLAELVRVQQVAVATAHARGLDPDQPRHLARSVILTPEST